MLEQERLELEQERLELEEKVRKQDQELLLVKQVRVDFFYISEVKMFILLIPLQCPQSVWLKPLESVNPFLKLKFLKTL